MYKKGSLEVCSTNEFVYSSGANTSRAPRLRERERKEEIKLSAEEFDMAGGACVFVVCFDDVS